MRILVCGGRDYHDKHAVHSYLEMIDSVDFLIHGGASGADRLASHWASDREIMQCEYKADWRTHGKAAGPIRNQQMIDEGKPDRAVAFPGGKGTADMVRRLKKAGIPVDEIA